jgi:ATP adenylyltransferase
LHPTRRQPACRKRVGKPALAFSGANRALTTSASRANLPGNMDHLHAYWRMEYIEAPRLPEGANPFVELPKLGNDSEALIVHRSPLSYLILNRYPYNPGHLLAIPFRPATDLSELTAAERADLMDEMIFGKEVLKAAVNPNGFNIGYNLGSAAGGSIPHLHAHIVPRWNGDTNFMPVIGQTRVLPQSLEAMYNRLKETVDKLTALR